VESDEVEDIVREDEQVGIQFPILPLPDWGDSGFSIFEDDSAGT
jgi:hypothetical protein